jgi:hypothetical protein
MRLNTKLLPVPSSPSTCHLAAADHTAADQGILPEAGGRHEEVHPGEVAADHTDHPGEGTDQEAERRTGLDPEEVDRTDRLEGERRTVLGEELRTGPGAAVHHTGLEEAAGHTVPGAVRRRSPPVDRTGRERGGWSSRPFDRSCDQWHRGEA